MTPTDHGSRRRFCPDSPTPFLSAALSATLFTLAAGHSAATASLLLPKCSLLATVFVPFWIGPGRRLPPAKESAAGMLQVLERWTLLAPLRSP